MSELSRLGPGSDDLHNRAKERDERLRRIIEESNRTGVPTEVILEREVLEQQQGASKRNREEESKKTTKSFSGLLKSLRAKYGIKSASEQSTTPSQDQSTRESPPTIYILDEEDDPRLHGQRYGKSLTSDEGETLEDDLRDLEHYEKNVNKADRETASKQIEQNRIRTENAHDEMERFFGDEKSYSMQVKIPHGNLSKTNVPPVSWKPGVGAMKALSELASYFKTLSDEKTFGQVHREKAMELLQKAAPYNLLFRDQREETPAISRVYSRMSEGTPAFDPNPAGPPTPERNPTQEEIWNQIVEEAAAEEAAPAFDPRGDNIPYAEKYVGVSAMPQHLVEHEIRHEKMYLMGEMKGIQGVQVGNRIDNMSDNPAFADERGLQTAKNPHGRPITLGQVSDMDSGMIIASGDIYHPAVDDYHPVMNRYVPEDDGSWSIRPEDRISNEEQQTKTYLMENGQYGKKSNGYDSEAQDYLNQLIDARRRKAETALRFADTSNNYDLSQHELRQQRRYGESFPGAEKEATETGDKHRTLQEDAWVEDYTTGDTLRDLESAVHNRYLDGGEYGGGYDLIESARKQVEDEPKKALSVLNSFFKSIEGYTNG